MMVVVGIISLIILGLVTFFTGGVRSWIAGDAQLKAQRDARQAMDIMIKEIRKGKEIVGGGASDKHNLTISIPGFTHTPSSDAYVVTFSLPSGTNSLRRLVGGASNVIINNVENISFTYYNSSSLEINPPDISASKINIVLELDVDKDDNVDIRLDTDVNLRNFGL